MCRCEGHCRMYKHRKLGKCDEMQWVKDTEYCSNCLCKVYGAAACTNEPRSTSRACSGDCRRFGTLLCMPGPSTPYRSYRAQSPAAPCTPPVAGHTRERRSAWRGSTVLTRTSRATKGTIEPQGLLPMSLLPLPLPLPMLPPPSMMRLPLLLPLLLPPPCLRPPSVDHRLIAATVNTPA